MNEHSEHLGFAAKITCAGVLQPWVHGSMGTEFIVGSSDEPAFDIEDEKREME